MPVITQITEQKRRANRRNIFLDGSFAFGCNLNVVARFRLVVGMQLSPEQISQIELGEVKQECFDKAMDYLSRRLHSRAELIRKLKRQEWGDAALNAVIENVTRLGYLDDKRFALAKATSAAQHKHHGRRRAYIELIRAGVKSDVADAALKEVYDQADSRQIARELVQKQANRMRKLDPQVARRRLAAMLMRRGFQYEDIRPVIDELLGGEGLPLAETYPTMPDVRVSHRFIISIESFTTIRVIDLSMNLAGLALANPTMTCSGTCGYAFEYADFLDLSRLGAFVTKSITREERAGNEPTRIVETRAGMLNAIGLANVGLDRFLSEKLPLLQKMPCPVIVNVAGHSFDDYVETCAAMNALDCVAAIELNVSCPNVKDGLTFGTDPGRLKELTRQVKSVLPDRPLIVKLSPNVEDITATARAAIEGGADILSMINTFTAMAIDIYKKRPRLANVTGGLSGPAIKPIALHLVSRVYRGVARDAGVPIIGMGGIQYWADALEFILAGCSAVAVGTALFVDPSTPNQIADGLADYLQKQNISTLKELVGTLQMPGDQPKAAPYP